MSPQPSFTLEAELSPSRFAEVGRPEGAYRRGDGGAVALVSTFDMLYWRARALYEGHSLRHRVSVYTGDLGTRLGVFDRARFPIQDVAFHPTRPIVAVGAGRYDGGFFFEGELFLWNWETGESWSVLPENRDVARLRFIDDDSLAVLLRPCDEEEFGAEDAFNLYVGGVIKDLRAFTQRELPERELETRSITEFTRVEPQALGFDCGVYTPEEHEAQWEAIVSPHDFEPRHRVWDLAWTDAERVLAVHAGCHAEEWTTSGLRTLHIRGEGYGVQVLRRRGATLVNVAVLANHLKGTIDTSTLCEVRDGRLHQVARFEEGVLFSVDRDGRILCRITGHIKRKKDRRDRVLGPGGEEIFSLNLGHYDCFNHYIRLDGGDGLYFLRGTPSTSSEDKVLCRIDEHGEVRECFPWEPKGKRYTSSAGRFLPDGSLARVYRDHGAKGPPSAAIMEVLEMPSGQSRWRRGLSAPATALEPVGTRPWLVYALTDGSLGLIDWKSGDLLHEEKLSVGGAGSVALSLAAEGDRLACGTLDGRVLVLRVEEKG